MPAASLPTSSSGLDSTTIAAIATPPGNGGVAVIRMSGPDAWTLAARILVTRSQGVIAREQFQPGRVLHAWVCLQEEYSRKEYSGREQADTLSKTLLDQVLVLPFRAPHSYTGEDVIEIHCHGGHFLSQQVLDCCFQVGAQPAQPGEFTKRAFLSGKMDLTQAESVLDLISAQGEALLASASNNLKNRSLAGTLAHLETALYQFQAQVTACVDFPEEVDEPDRGVLHQQLTALLNEVETLSDRAYQNRFIREGMKVALLGLPNAGKSSLFNALLAAERSIVTDIPGTTRDVVSETFTVGGVVLTLLDTAGIREDATSPVEQLGIERTWQSAADASAALYLFDATVGLQPADREILAALPKKLPCLLLASKSDCLASNRSMDNPATRLSVKSGEGIQSVVDWLHQQVQQARGGDTASGDAAVLVLNQRQQACLQGILENLREACETAKTRAVPIDLLTVSLSQALYHLDQLLGKNTTEAMLSEVFQQFCVGK